MIMMEFNLREKGYALDFTLDDLKVDLFKKSLTNSEDQEMTPLVKKLLSAKVTSKQYMKLKVLGSPLDKPHLDT